MKLSVRVLVMFNSSAGSGGVAHVNWDNVQLHPSLTDQWVTDNLWAEIMRCEIQVFSYYLFIFDVLVLKKSCLQPIKFVSPLTSVNAGFNCSHKNYLAYMGTLPDVFNIWCQSMTEGFMKLFQGFTGGSLIFLLRFTIVFESSFFFSSAYVTARFNYQVRLDKVYFLDCHRTPFHMTRF